MTKQIFLVWRHNEHKTLDNTCEAYWTDELADARVLQKAMFAADKHAGVSILAVEQSQNTPV